MWVIIVAIIIIWIATRFVEASSLKQLSGKASRRSVQYYVGDIHLYVRIGNNIIACYGNGTVVTPSAKVVGYYSEEDGYMFDSENHVLGECKNGWIKNTTGNVIGKYSAGDIDLYGDYPLCEYNSGNPKDGIGASTAAVILLVVGKQKDFSDVEIMR